MACMTWGVPHLTGRPQILHFYLKGIWKKSCSLFLVHGVLEQRQDPKYSPLYADLHHLPPALFTVGATDPLADDTYFMEARWRMAGNKTYLAVYPESGHGLDLYPTQIAKIAKTKMFQWINDLSK